MIFIAAVASIQPKGTVVPEPSTLMSMTAALAVDTAIIDSKAVSIVANPKAPEDNPAPTY